MSSSPSRSAYGSTGVAGSQRHARPGRRPRAASRASRTGAARRLDVEGDDCARRPRRSRAPSGPGPRSSGGSRAAASLTAAQRARRPAARGSGWARSGCPSRRRAPSRRAARSGATSSARSAKSADRMLGEIWTPMAAESSGSGSTGSAAAQQGEVHRVGAVPVRPELHVRAVAEVRHAGQAAAGRRPARRRRRRRRCSTSATTPRVSARCGEQVDVGDDAAGPDGVERRVEQVALQRAPARRRPRAAAASAPRAGGAARRARCTARRPAPGRTPPARQAGARAVGDDDRRPAVAGRRAATSPARCGCQLGGEQRARRARPASAPSSAALPPGPAHRSSQRSSRPVERRGGQRERDELAALVLHAGPALAHRGERAGVAAGQHRGVRRPAARLGARRRRSSADRRPGPGRATSVTCGRLVVGRQQRPRSRAQAAAERVAAARETTQRGCECATARWPTRVARRTAARPRQPRRRGPARPTLRSTALTNCAAALADHRRGPARRSRATAACDGHPHARAAGGRRAAARRAPAGRPGRSGRSTQAARTASYVPAAAQRAVGELGRERRVAPVEAALAQQRRAGRGWRRRRARRPRAAASNAARRGGVGPRLARARRTALPALRRRAGHRRSVAAVEVAHAAGPVGRRHRPAPGRPHLAEPHRVPSPVPTSTSLLVDARARPAARSARVGEQARPGRA